MRDMKASWDYVSSIVGGEMGGDKYNGARSKEGKCRGIISIVVILCNI